MLHVLGVVLWIGGVAFITAVLLPAVKRMRGPAERVAFFENMEDGFAREAQPLLEVRPVSYWMLKYTHVSAVIASFALFFLRGLWMMAAPEKLAARWVRVVPHVIDTVLLASAIALAGITSQYPFVQPWLTAKVLALVVYIVLGTVAIRRGRTRRVRVVAWILALIVFGYMVAVARERVPFPWAI